VGLDDIFLILILKVTTGLILQITVTLLQSMLIALCNKIQILSQKGESINLTMLQLGLPNFLIFKNCIHHVLTQIMIKRTLHTTEKTQTCKFSCQQEEDFKIPLKKTLYPQLASVSKPKVCSM